LRPTTAKARSVKDTRMKERGRDDCTPGCKRITKSCDDKASGNETPPLLAFDQEFDFGK
jgi:hypothetical protein